MRVPTKVCLLAAAVATLLSVSGWSSDDDAEPIACPDLIEPSVWHDGAFFYNVPMHKTGNPGGGWLYNFENLSEPVSFTGRWKWVDGGGTFKCYRVWLIRGELRADVAVSQVLWGPVVPNVREDDPNEGGGGGEGGHNPPNEENSDWPSNSGGGSAGDYEGSRLDMQICWWWVVRDYDTGEVLSVTFLYCEPF
jgi:hypothetical protein